MMERINIRSGYGSSNTKIRRLTNILTNQGIEKNSEGAVQVDAIDDWIEPMLKLKEQTKKMEELLMQGRFEEVMPLCISAENSIDRLRNFAYRNVE